MVLAIPGDGTSGQADLIISSAEDYLFGWTQTVLHPKRKYSLALLVSQCILVQMNQIYMELKQRVFNEGLHPGVLAEDTYSVIGHWGPSFQGIACPIPWSCL